MVVLEQPSYWFELTPLSQYGHVLLAILEQPPYCFKLAPFPKLKHLLFLDEKVIIRVVATDLLLEEVFQQCVDAWHRRMGKCARFARNPLKGNLKFTE